MQMPTPVQHLIVADAILSHPRLPHSLRDFLSLHRGAFLFGNTAPDVQTVSGQTREATHFFAVPLQSGSLAHEAMFRAHPGLSRPDRLPPAQAAFLAGYVSHLLLDVFWVRDVFVPVFGPDVGWGSFRERLFLHNVLRAWCDRHDQAQLEGTTGPALAAVRPDHWLPFTEDKHLGRWRDVLVEQFEPGAVIRTVEVFAERGKVSPQDFETILNSDDHMSERVFNRVSRASIEDFYVRGIAQTLQLIVAYFDH